MNNIKKTLLTIWIFVWSLPLTIFSLVASIFLLMFGAKPVRFGPAVAYKIGESWGGFELGGCFFTIDSHMYYSTKCHEVGHLLQQAMFGPLSPFMFTFPSAARYWLRNMRTINGKYTYSILLTIIGMAVFATIFALGLKFNILWIWVAGLCLMIYMIILGIWLIFFETPKYKPGKKYPLYDDFWIEGDATRRGTAFMKKYYPDVK